jgi:phage terminase large subunit-like protein
MAKFIHISGSDELVLDNSRDIQEGMNLPEYKALFDVRLANENVKKWYTKQGGGFYAVSAAGQITGFGAGLVDEEEEEKSLDEFTDYDPSNFGGAIIVDDPIKPDDALSDTLRNKVNKKFNSTIRTRVNSRRTPIIVIGHRLHTEDLCGFLIANEPEEWTVLSIPCILTDEDGNEKALWEHKQTLEELRELRRIDPFVFATQYMQQPYVIEGGRVKKEWFVKIEESEIPPGIAWDLWIDSAYTEDKNNDPTGFVIAGNDIVNNRVIIRHAECDYFTIPDALNKIKELIARFGDDASMVCIEPKASGYSFIQMLRKDTYLNVTKITGRLVQDGKAARVNYAAPKIESSRVHLVRGNWNDEFITQLCAFPNYGHDEYCDLLGYATKKYLG